MGIKAITMNLKSQLLSLLWCSREFAEWMINRSLYSEDISINHQKRYSFSTCLSLFSVPVSTPSMISVISFAIDRVAKFTNLD